jgi:hypothetical protein
MQEYFDRVGARSVCATTLEEASCVGAELDAAVIFADDMPVETMARSARDLPVRLVIVVTREVEAVREMLWSKPSRARVLVLPRLAWGFTLVEVVRRSLPVSQAMV